MAENMFTPEILEELRCREAEMEAGDRPVAPAQHTPGPWHWEFVGTAGNYRLFNEAGGQVVTSAPPLRSGEQFPPDMQLQAAAPEMLDALRAIVTLAAYMANYRPSLLLKLGAIAQTAIAKTEGGGQ